MLAELDLKTFRELVSKASRDELIWMNGFLAGLMQNGGTGAVAATPPAAAPVLVKKITLTYGTETGNAKKLAAQFAAVAKKKGITVKLAGLDQYRLTDLAKEEYIFTVVSTQGDGEPPAAALKFYNYIHEQQPQLNQVQFAVLGLGDTAYPLFCKTAEDVDAQLAKLGGKRLLPLLKCDTDYEADATQWFEQVLQALSGSATTAAAVATVAKKTPHKKNYTGTVITNINLNDRGSNKQTHHLEIASDDTIEYLPGDSLGLVPYNKTAIVESLFHITGFKANQEIQYRDQTYTALALLQQKLCIQHLPERVVAKYAAVVGQDIPAMRIDLADLLKIYPVKDAAQFEDVIAILEPIAPRLYSISSSPAAHGNEVHLTVSRCGFDVNGEKKFGLCSDYLSQLNVDDRFDFYIHHNSQFRLPAEDKDVIMIGPGTGIAPFRSFIAERDALGASGRNWLFFGEQYFGSDFLYQTEIQSYVQTGALQKVSLAFSRDQEEKIYVQHRMQQQAAELWQWLEGGAVLYVCGAREPMSRDVEQTLLQVISEQGGRTREEAQAYLDQLANDNRYLKDVY